MSDHSGFTPAQQEAAAQIEKIVQAHFDGAAICLLAADEHALEYCAFAFHGGLMRCGGLVQEAQRLHTERMQMQRLPAMFGFLNHPHEEPPPSPDSQH